MATFALRRFSRPEALKTIGPCRLWKFLLPHAEFLGKRGLILPPESRAHEIDLGRLIAIFMSPDSTPENKTPQELVDALYVVDELATPEGMDALIEAAEDAGLALDRSDELSPADVAIQVWLLDPDTVQAKHAEQHLQHPRSFEYFPMNGKTVPDFKLPTARQLRAIESDLDDWFEKHKRGRGARVFVYPREDCVWFLVRHGEPWRREGSIENDESTSVLYRPERFDVMVYEQTIGELRIHANSKGEKTLYHERLGYHLFGDKVFFGDSGKYTLEPLRADGEASLRCDDVPGMEWIKLKEIHYYWPGAEPETEIRKAEDVFAALKARKGTMPARPKIIRAGFEVKFKDSKTPRRATIRVPNNALYRRDDDSAFIDQWLSARGFTLSQSATDAAEAEEVEAILVGP
jgi:hypothetical protein